jgi:hypothetical protein
MLKDEGFPSLVLRAKTEARQTSYRAGLVTDIDSGRRLLGIDLVFALGASRWADAFQLRVCSL